LETLVELVAKIKADSTELEKGLTDAERKTEASSKKMQESLKKVGTVMTASGAAITAAFGLMGKAAIDEDINMKRLATTINNSGTAYDSVKDSMEALIATTQRKTGVADDEQRNILNRLILVTNDYNTALSLLPTVLDLAAAGEMDATTAATYLGKAFLELEDGAEEVSVRFGQASLQFKNMEDIQNRVAGAAENLANPLSVLKASIGDVAESLGANLIPLIKSATNWIVDIAIKIQDWAKEHPTLAKTLTLVALAVGAVLTVVGGLILAMPVITGMVAAFGVVFHAALGPIGLISLAIAGLIAIGILLWKNWDKVSSFFSDVWTNMKIVVLTGVDAMLGYLEKFLGWIPGIGDKIKSARDAIAGMIAKDKVAQDIKETQKNLEELTKTVTAEFGKQASEIKASYDKKRAESKKTYDDAVKAINKEYGIGEAAKEVSKTKIDAAKRGTQELKDSYEREKGYAKDRYDLEIDKLETVYNARIKNLDQETDATVKALQDQIDALDKQTAKEELIITRAEEQKRLAELRAAIDSAKTAEDKTEAQQNLTEYITQVTRNELLRQRDAEKSALRDSIETTQEKARNEKERLQESLDTNKQTLKDIYDASVTSWNKLSTQADTNLANELARIEIDRLAAIQAQSDILTAELGRLADAEKASIGFYVKQLADANQQVVDINLAYDKLQKRYDIEIVTHQITVSGGGTITLPPSATSDTVTATQGFEGFASGGIVTQPTLAMIGETGAEAVIPLNETGGLGGITINFTQPVFFDREDTMNRFVDMIRKGIQRQDRIRFGGAYNG